VRTRTAAALVWTRALVELMCTRPKDERCGEADANEKDKMSLSFLFFKGSFLFFYYFLEKPCMLNKPVGRSAA
jgi:hypothetical protein